MAKRTVTHVLKDRRGNITFLGGPDDRWSPRSAGDVIADIESGRHDYVVPWPERETDIHIVDDPHGRYLRTDRDPSKRNNLDELPIAPRFDLTADDLKEIKKSQILESVNTSANISEAQGARIKDPLWFLARQWQTGEFEAESGGSPAQTDVSWTAFPLDRLLRGDATTVLDPIEPLDAAVESEQGRGTSPAWRSENLEYSFDLLGSGWRLHAEEYHGRGLDWYHFDVADTPAAAFVGNKQSRRVIPTRLQIAAMPEPRWWRLEESSAFLEDFTDPEPNLLSMLVPEFLYIDSNNWFAIPLEEAVGHIRRIDSVTVVDSFGVSTTLEPVGGSGAWRIFSFATEGTNYVGGALLLVPNLGAGVVEGEIIEEVAYVRDEDANLVWAVEKLYFDEGAGATRNRGDELAAQARFEHDDAGLSEEMRGLPAYRLKSHVAANWIPYIPRVIEGQGANATEVYLRRARSLETSSSANPQYVGRVVAESWRLHEEEVPRTGVRVQRLWRFARGGDGTAHVWVGRRRDPAFREPTSGLEFDYLD